MEFGCLEILFHTTKCIFIISINSTFVLLKYKFSEMKLKNIICNTVLACLSCVGISQTVPKVYTNIYYDAEIKNYYYKNPSEGKVFYADTVKGQYTLPDFSNNPEPYDSGFILKFCPDCKGSLLYGLIDINNKLPRVVYYRYPASVINGKVKLNILTKINGLYDFVDWKKNGKGKIGYRFVDNKGQLTYDGSLVFNYKDNRFYLDTSFTQGPFVAKISSNEATIWFNTNFSCVPEIKVKSAGEEKSFHGKEGFHHEIKLHGLQADTQYNYTITLGDYSETNNFTTFPKEGSQTPFVFAYASDCRSGQGSDERDFMGVNTYVMSKIAALSLYEKARFVQITGDVISGYQTDENTSDIQYTSFKNAISPYAGDLPFYIGMGNHEAIAYEFDKRTSLNAVDKFPFEKCSQEKVFADNFVLPQNGPESEDGTIYDPDAKTIDFPSYSENVYYYTCGNVAMVVLNSEYLYTQSELLVDKTGGNIHGYIMDMQTKWLSETLEKLEKDKNIDHVFVTAHSPFFPNGGHVEDAMWYSGNNKVRPVIAGKATAKGIVERRDELLDIMINHSTKVTALLCGDEHNYSRMLISPSTKIYIKTYDGNRLKILRNIWQITNGAAGAPYYGKEETPWMLSVQKFAVQYALCLFYINGKEVSMKVINPETLELIEEVKLK